MSSNGQRVSRTTKLRSPLRILAIFLIAIKARSGDESGVIVDAAAKVKGSSETAESLKTMSPPTATLSYRRFHADPFHGHHVSPAGVRMTVGDDTLATADDAEVAPFSTGSVQRRRQRSDGHEKNDCPFFGVSSHYI